MTNDDYRNTVRELLDSIDRRLTDWEIQFLDDMLGQDEYTGIERAVINKIYNKRL